LPTPRESITRSYGTRVRLLTWAFLWEGDAMIDLGTLGGATSVARALNDRGQIVGYSSTASGETRAFLWEDGHMIDLGTLEGDSYAVAINRHGQILAYSYVNNLPHAFLWEDGKLTALGTLPGRMASIGHALNNRGQVVGVSYTVGEYSVHAFVWEHGTMTDLGTLPGGAASVAFDINERGEIAGWSSAGRDGNSAQHAVLWTTRKVADLPKRL